VTIDSILLQTTVKVEFKDQGYRVCTSSVKKQSIRHKDITNTLKKKLHIHHPHRKHARQDSEVPSNTMAQNSTLPINHHWYHAVNSQDKLNVALRAAESTPVAAKTHSIEADTIYSESKQQAVMGHPPACDGDLTLQSFLEQLQQSSFQYPSSSIGDTPDSTNRIVKLDFKSMKAFQSSISHVQSYLSKLPRRFHHLVWINADILPGPGEDINDEQAQVKLKPKFDAVQFLQVVTTQLPGTTLSIGWTTSLSDTRAVYTSEMVQEMMVVLKPYNDLKVTFPIRGTSFRHSFDVLQHLYINDWTITLWWSLEKLPKEEFDWIYHTFEKGEMVYRNRTYYDLAGFEDYLSCCSLDK
jgi:hypothetical protein